MRSRPKFKPGSEMRRKLRRTDFDLGAVIGMFQLVRACEIGNLNLRYFGEHGDILRLCK